MTMKEAKGLHWHVAHSSNASEDRVEKALNKSPYKFYYPKTIELRRVPKRELTAAERNKPFGIVRPCEVPLFHRYYFVQFDPIDGECWELFKLIGIQGVICDSTSGLRPAPVHDVYVEWLRSQEVNGAIPGKVTVKKLAYALGEEVRISEGPFAGFNAIVDSLPDDPIERLDESSRLRLLVGLFGRASVVEMAIGDIEKL